MKSSIVALAFITVRHVWKARSASSEMSVAAHHPTANLGEDVAVHSGGDACEQHDDQLDDVGRLHPLDAQAGEDDLDVGHGDVAERLEAQLRVVSFLLGRNIRVEDDDLLEGGLLDRQPHEEAPEQLVQRAQKLVEVDSLRLPQPHRHRLLGGERRHRRFARGANTDGPGPQETAAARIEAAEGLREKP
eukprot:CAMPEP_0119385430 /NCGR_PEP_ID=MMETSP1334-20130426/91196_1 /TAXON_ID=127549 /ORGANISM="Calcidiscus leptoporus, Strain RCC1130" /LENGTH=188 /DNA_ID=CAMNT_0007406717 /DNA_START=138 /DNA_END=700 /DNA_ORIENTATION=-